MNIEDTKEINALDDEIEGLENEDASLGDYPIDTFLIRNETRTVHDVVRRIKQDFYIMNPDFQRDFIWSEEKQSKLIESVLMRIPLPVFYLAEDKEGKMIVVDGLQRLSTFKRFLNNEFHLKLPKQNELDKKNFKELSPKLQNRIEDCNLILYIIDVKVPERARLDIFERVNSGELLTRQQMRNCLYNGKATRFLKQEAEKPLFKLVTGNRLNPKTMRDRECVNRFCAFHLLPLENYKGEMDEWLAEALRKMNELDDSELEKISQSFKNALENNHFLFNSQAFRKHIPQQSKRGILNISLWDVMTVGLVKYSNEQIESNAEKLKSGFYNLLKNEEFSNSITYSTYNTGSVKKRFELSQKMFQEVFNA
jgi:hypothetical protein